MKIFSMKCDKGCHGQFGIIVGPFQFEAAYDLSKIKAGATVEANNDAGALAGTVYFGPFMFALGLRWRPARNLPGQR